MKMKRYNFHLPQEWDKQLDEITKSINKEVQKKDCWCRPTKADVIRMAIGITYGLERRFYFGDFKTVAEIIQKMFKK